MRNNKKVSIEDIADAADVSTAIVSWVLNNSSKVRQETASWVFEAANQLNYRLDRVARRMRVKSSDSMVLGLIITDVPFFQTYLEELKI